VTPEQIERIRKALGANKATPISPRSAKGPIDWIRQARAVAQVRQAKMLDLGFGQETEFNLIPVPGPEEWSLLSWLRGPAADGSGAYSLRTIITQPPLSVAASRIPIEWVEIPGVDAEDTPDPLPKVA
jgi:hypothetical protein